MGIQVNIHEAKTRFSELLKAVEAGETVIIARANKPIAQLHPVMQAREPLRVLGSLKGQVSVPDDFDTFMQDEIIEMFEGGPIEPRE